MTSTSHARRLAGRLRGLLRVLSPVFLTATALGTLACAAPTTPTTSTTYTGTFTGEESLSSGTNGVASCAWRMTYTGTMKIVLDKRQDGAAAGTADVQTTQYAGITQLLGPPPPDPRCFAYTPITSTWTLPVTGTLANLAFTGQKNFAAGSTNTFTFSGTLASGVISGTAIYTELTQNGVGFSSGSATFAVTLR